MTENNTGDLSIIVMGIFETNGIFWKNNGIFWKNNLNGNFWKIMGFYEKNNGTFWKNMGYFEFSGIFLFWAGYFDF